MGAFSSFHPKNLSENNLPVRSKADNKYAININFSVILEKDEDLKFFRNEKTNLLVIALNQKFTEKHIQQKISTFYRDYTLNQYYMDFLLTETEYLEIVNKEIDLDIYFYNDNFYFEKKTTVFIRPESQEGFISEDELIELDLVKGGHLFNNKKKKIRIGIKYRLHGDFIYSYILENQKKFLSFYKFFEFLIHSENPLLEEYYYKNISMINSILKKLRNEKNNQIGFDYLNQEFNNSLDSLFLYYYKKNLRLKSRNANQNDSYLDDYEYIASSNENNKNLKNKDITKKKVISYGDEREKIFNRESNNIELKKLDINMDFGKNNNIYSNPNDLNINLINEKNIEKEYEINPDKQNVEFIDYEILLTKSFYKHDPLINENTRKIQYNLIYFAKKNLFELFKIIMRDFNCKLLNESFLDNNLFNILFAASSGNHKMINIFDMIFKNEKLFQIYEEKLNLNNLLNLLRNSAVKNEITKNEIFPYLIISEKARNLIMNPNSLEEIKKIFANHKNGKAKLDLIDLLNNNSNLIFDLINSKSNYELNHLRLFNLFAYILSIREVIEILYYNKNIGKKNGKANENIYTILSNIENNYEKMSISEMDINELKRIITNNGIQIEPLLKYCNENFFKMTKDEIFGLINKLKNDISNENIQSSINKNLIKFLKLIFKFNKLSLTHLDALFDKSILKFLPDLVYSQLELLELKEIVFFLENKFEFLIDSIFSGHLSESSVRNIFRVILNNRNAFTYGKKNPFNLEDSEIASYKRVDNSDTKYLYRFRVFVEKKYVENVIKSVVFSVEKIQFPFYILNCVSRVDGFLDVVNSNLIEWKDLFYRNASFEKFFEINFFEIYNKISYIKLMTNIIFMDYYLNDSKYRNISNTNYISEKENEIELSDVKVISRESFSFNYPGFIPILLTDIDKKPFYPTHIYLQQPNEEMDTNVKSALFLSGKGNYPNIQQVNTILHLIENGGDYSKLDYKELKFLGYLETDKIKKGLYKEHKSDNCGLTDYLLVILVSNFDNEIILTTGPFGCYGTHSEVSLDYINKTDYKYLKDKFLFDEI